MAIPLAIERHEPGVSKVIRFVGAMLVISGLVIFIRASIDVDKRMPTQVLHRRFAVYPLTAGAVLLVIAATEALLP